MDMPSTPAVSARFPHAPTFSLAGHTLDAAQVITLLSPYISETRRARIHEVVAARTCEVVTVCDSLYDEGNIAAVMRSAESMGFQQMHLIRTFDETKFSKRVTAGSDKWLDTTTWDHPVRCLSHLKAQGYQIIATHLDANAKPLSAFDFTRPTALVLGNERDGVSAQVLAMCDARAIIPMDGFTQSFNISVAAALSLYHIRHDRVTRRGYHGDLSEREQEILRASFYVRGLKEPERLVRGLLGAP